MCLQFIKSKPHYSPRSQSVLSYSLCRLGNGDSESSMSKVLMLGSGRTGF